MVEHESVYFSSVHQDILLATIGTIVDNDPFTSYNMPQRFSIENVPRRDIPNLVEDMVTQFQTLHMIPCTFQKKLPLLIVKVLSMSKLNL
jgi:hypothetical protein